MEIEMREPLKLAPGSVEGLAGLQERRVSALLPTRMTKPTHAKSNPHSRVRRGQVSLKSEYTVLCGPLGSFTLIQ
jgi:hypothetical protein